MCKPFSENMYLDEGAMPFNHDFVLEYAPLFSFFRKIIVIKQEKRPPLSSVTEEWS
ncbi:hypothetical protein SAMN04487936_101608 [Halobacillus dabanensis]|uniref:Uncharacterized protein n=1 Tax=Halobacillus dabanensis TaxID=240302 RepID=A0A1I3QAG6_HALDA|nr:hypothetical protein SAMN04487936_101608 [Halobacillus dabanensis]